MRKLSGAAALALIVLGAAGAFAHGGTSKGVTIEHPWVRATPGGSNLTAAFMQIKTDAGTTDKFLGGTSPVGRLEVHTHIMEGDVMKMRRVDSLDLKAGESRILKPGGDHIMLLDLKAPLKDGDLVKMTLNFQKAGSIEVEATVEPVGATGPHGMDHQPSAEDEKSGGEHHHQH